MRFNFPVIVIDEDYRSENTSGLGIRALAEAIEKEGLQVLGVTSYGDMASFAQQQSRGSAFILSIDDEEFSSPEAAAKAIADLRAFVSEIRMRNADIPIFLHGETRTSRHIPNDVLRELHGFIHMYEDTPEFIARNVVREAKAYLESLPPPFFRALTHYASDGSYSWHCPGHSGGVAFLKSPVGQMFHQFFGENMLRADVCNSVDELGQLLTSLRLSLAELSATLTVPQQQQPGRPAPVARPGRRRHGHCAGGRVGGTLLRGRRRAVTRRILRTQPVHGLVGQPVGMLVLLTRNPGEAHRLERRRQ